jgi:Rrf2 family protein
MVTRAADYALRALLVLAGRTPGSRLRLNELAEECEVPPAFLYKVVRSLADAGLLAAHRGTAGGYELTARAWQATVLDVVDAMNGVPLLNTCVLSGACHRAPGCPAHPVWEQAQACVRQVLASARLADLAAGGPKTAAAGLCVPRERPCADQNLRRPAREDRRPRGTHRKRMTDR